jgi:hypothetical protein
LIDLESAAGTIRSSARLVETFRSLCGLGGRLAGTDSELAARDFVGERLAKIGGIRRDHEFPFEGWQPGSARASLESARGTFDLDVVTLPGSPAGAGLHLRVADADWDTWDGSTQGQAVLTSHGYPFTTGHVHRRLKYRRGCEIGAGAFLIANNLPGIGPVTGGVGGLTDLPNIPAVGLSQESGALIRTALHEGPASISLDIEAHLRSWTARNLILDIPGRGDDWVVLCAHLDGHHLAESAMDNATGIAVMLEVGHLLADLVPSLPCGLRLIAFTVEERGLQGSKRYVAELSEQERQRIRCAVALDTVTGDSRFSALTGGHPSVEALVGRVSAVRGVPIDVVPQPLANSDHYSFQAAGIPALRLMSGYDDPESSTRYLLTSRDRRDLVDANRLKDAAVLATTLVYLACAEERGT